MGLVYLNIKIMLINVNKSCMQSFIEIGQPIKEEMGGKYRYICNGYAPIITVRYSNKSRYATAKISIYTWFITLKKLKNKE